MKSNRRHHLGCILAVAVLAGISVSSATDPATFSPIVPSSIPDDAWSKVTLTDDQSAQLKDLRSKLQADQLATIHMIASQGVVLRKALLDAEQLTGQPQASVKARNDILALTDPLQTRYAQYVKDASALLNAGQLTQLMGLSTDILKQKQVAAPITAPPSVSPDADEDDDGMPSAWELQHGLNPLDPGDAGIDSDGDGVVNYTEYLLGTDPQNPDSDSDGVPDGVELNKGLNPRNAADGAGPDRNGNPKSSGTSGSTTGSSSSGSGSTGTNGVTGVVVRILEPATGSVVK